jgi:hypothetical protein
MFDMPLPFSLSPASFCNSYLQILSANSNELWTRALGRGLTESGLQDLNVDLIIA